MLLRFPFLQYNLWSSIYDLSPSLYSSMTKEERTLDVYLQAFLKNNACEVLRKKKENILLIPHSIERKYYTDWMRSEYSIESLYYSYNKSLNCLKEKQLFKDGFYWEFLIWYKATKKLRIKEREELKKKILTDFHEPLKEMGKCCERDIDFNQFASSAMAILYRARFLKKKYRKMLQRLKPSKIVEVCHYKLDTMIINNEAHQLGIPTIELQHGTIHPEHFAYHYAIDELIPEPPRYICTYSEFWNSMLQMPLESTDLVATGSTVFEEKILFFKKNIT